MTFVPRHLRPGCAAVFGALALLAGACARPAEPAPPPLVREAPARTANIEVAFDGGADTTTVRWCFDGRPPSLRLRTRRQARATVAITDDRGHDLRTPRGDRLDPPTPLAGCLVHVLETAPLVRERDGAGGDVLLAVHDMFLRPHPLPVETHVRFRTKENLYVTTAWPRTRDGHGFHPAPSVHRFPSYVAVGPRPPRTIRLSGGTLRVRSTGGAPGETAPAVTALAEDAAASLVAVYGTMPRSTLALFLRPSRWGGSVGFGQLVRGGGAAVVLHVSPDASPSALVGTWTGTHEFMHAAMPFADDPWLGEGIASYFTEVARTRRGHRTEAEGWAALDAAFERGRRRGRGLSLEATSRSMHALFAYQRVYWAGAAVCFLLDVEIRRRTANREGLDDALHTLTDLLDAPRTIPWHEIVGRFESRYGPGLTDLVRTHLRRRSFPDVEPAYAFLGIRRRDGTIHLDDTAEGAQIRRSIMAPREGPRAMASGSDPAESGRTPSPP